MTSLSFIAKSEPVFYLGIGDASPARSHVYPTARTAGELLSEQVPPGKPLFHFGKRPLRIAQIVQPLCPVR